MEDCQIKVHSKKSGYGPGWEMQQRNHVCNAGFRLVCRFAAMSRDHHLLFHGLQLSAAMPLWLITERHRSWIELKSTVCDLPRWPTLARLAIYWQDTVRRLVIPLRQVALVQLYKYHHQSSKCSEQQAVWKQHKLCRFIPVLLLQATSQYLVHVYFKNLSWNYLHWCKMGYSISIPYTPCGRLPYTFHTRNVIFKLTGILSNSIWTLQTLYATLWLHLPQRV